MKPALWMPLVLIAPLLIGAQAVAVGSLPSASGPLVLTILSPATNGTVGTTTPTIEVQYSDSVSTINSSLVFVYVDDENVTATGLVTVTDHVIAYPVPSLLQLRDGANNATVTATDMAGNTASISWNFTVSPSSPPPSSPLGGLTPARILLYLGVAAAVAGAVVGGFILYLRQTARFTFRRYFATHPVRKTYLVLYLPIAAAFVFVLVALSYVFSTPGLPSNAVDYVFIAAIFIALTAFGIDARAEMQRIRSFERAFAQFLFEMADAMRGGIDPAKALVELSKTSANILRKHLRIAADSIRLGRPFEVVLREMARPMRSDLINRYAGLIADATGIGGETATVVYRAAKDMDDFVKIEDEREKQLMLPVAVVYIAYAVLLAVLFALIYIAPDLGSLNISILGSSNVLASGAATTVPKLSVATLKERFFELMIINALGTGAIIGAFTEGRARYGILHSLALVAATAIAFAIVFPS